jgi:hypothetical protein
MNPVLLTLTTVCFTVGLSTVALTQATTNKPDRLGDYYSNEAPLKGTATRSLMAGSLWEVVASQLNCRRGSGTEYAIVRRFKRGDVLEAEVYRGGSDEVLRNATDRSGKPWMPVRGTSAVATCYVRASKRYIQPLKGEEVRPPAIKKPE